MLIVQQPPTSAASELRSTTSASTSVRLMLGYLMYRSGLVPRRMAMLGLIGGPMLILSFVLTLFGAYENGSGPSARSPSPT